MSDREINNSEIAQMKKRYDDFKTGRRLAETEYTFLGAPEVARSRFVWDWKGFFGALLIGLCFLAGVFVAAMFG